MIILIPMNYQEKVYYFYKVIKLLKIFMNYNQFLKKLITSNKLQVFKLLYGLLKELENKKIKKYYYYKIYYIYIFFFQ